MMSASNLARVAAVLALVIGACGPGETGGGGGGGSSTAAPAILALQTDLGALTPADPLVIHAVVTDPDGLDDILGGNLLTPDSVSVYGAFSSDASKGAYSISLSWANVNTIAPVKVDAGGRETRALRVEFFDLEGNTVSRDISIELGV